MKKQKIKIKPKTFTQGITNETEDRMFLLYADYDDCFLDVVEKDALFIQKHYDIGDIIITASSNQTLVSGRTFGNFHLISFTKLMFPEIIEIITNLRCDWKYKKGWKFLRNWVIRISAKKNIKTGKTTKPKPILLSYLSSQSKRTYSKAHLDFFTKKYNFKLSKNKKNIDNSKNVELVEYVTR